MNNNIKQGKGFICPTCESKVPPGYEVCYNCGEMPGATSSTGDSELFGCLASLAFLIFSPIIYMITVFLVEAEGEVLFVLLLLPNTIIVVSVVYMLIKELKDFGWHGFLIYIIHIWNLYFSGKSLIIQIQFFVDL